MSNLIEQLKRHEGYRSKVYTDTFGHQTIGYGFNLDAGMPEDEADAVLRIRIVKIYLALCKALPWFEDLDQVRKDALTNMAYNLGVEGLLRWKKTLTAIEEGRYEDASKIMLTSLWRGQVGNRATELAEQIRTGECKDG